MKVKEIKTAYAKQIYNFKDLYFTLHGTVSDIYFGGLNGALKQMWESDWLFGMDRCLTCMWELDAGLK